MSKPKSSFTINQTVDLTSDPNMGIQKQCSELNGKFYHIELKNTLNECLADRIRMLENEEITTSSNGVYVWIIATLPNDDFGLFAIKTLTIHEISTKHLQLINRIKEKYRISDNFIIHGAGEFIKTDTKIVVNFLSGTYMSDVISDMTEDQKRQVQDEIADAILAKTKDRLGVDISIFSPSNDTFIKNENLQFNYDDFILFIECGATITEYNTKNDCFNNTAGYMTEYYRAKAQHDMNLRSYESGYSKTDPGEFIKPERPSERGLILTIDMIRSRIAELLDETLSEVPKSRTSSKGGKTNTKKDKKRGKSKTKKMKR
jgi:hypothetical protein